MDNISADTLMTLARKSSAWHNTKPSLALMERSTTTSTMPTADPIADPVLETRIFWDRHRREIIAAILVALIAAAGFAGYRYYHYRRDTAAAQALASAKSGPDYQKVIADYPGTAAGGTAALLFAEQERAAGKFADANATLQNFIDKNPQHELVGIARMAMGANLESLGKRDEALTTYQRIAAADPRGFNAPLALISQIHLLKEKNQIDEARRVCETVINQYRDSYLVGEATRQLRLLKRPNEASTPAASQQPAIPPPAPPVGPAPARAASPNVKPKP